MILLFLALTAFALSAWLLFDLVSGARQSRETQQERWQRAMRALSPDPCSHSGEVRTPVQRTAPAVETRTDRYDLAA